MMNNIKESTVEMKLFIIDLKDDKEYFVRNFKITDLNVLPVIDWVKWWLKESKIEYDKICSYVNEENTNEFIILYGGEMYFLLRRS